MALPPFAWALAAIGVFDLMGIKTIRNEKQDLTVHEASGLISEVEMYEAQKNFYKNNPTTLLLWDMSQAEVSHITSDILRKFAIKSAELGALRQTGRTAVVAPEDLQFALARMSGVFSEMESAPYSFRPFRTREEALQWLKSDKFS
jgi:hypothetical protein